MQIIQITNREQWDEFVGTQPQAQFAQSWEWADFQSRQAGRAWRIGVIKESQLLVVAKVVKKPLFLGQSYLYCDRGPIFKDNRWSVPAGQALFAELEKLAEAENAVFLRFDPIFNLVETLLNLTKTIDIQPKKTAILDLVKTEDELLAGMHQKTRYNIRLAQKKGVVIEQVGANRFAEFWQLMEETRERDEFSLHDKQYYQDMLGVSLIKLYFATYQGRVVATSIVAHYGDMATYVHGGSSNASREVMAPFLLQWTAIFDAKKSGLKHYDFYGVDEAKWPGVTRFKMGFNPGVFEYPGTHDLVYKKVWYSVYEWLRKIRRKF